MYLFHMGRHYDAYNAMPFEFKQAGKKTLSLSNSQDREDCVTSHSHVYYTVAPLAWKHLIQINSSKWPKSRIKIHFNSGQKSQILARVSQ